MEIRPYGRFEETEILPLYADAGWTNYTSRPEMLRAAYEHSLCVLAAYDDGRLAGIVRAVGDGASILYIQDLLVFEKFQRRGIGTRLMHEILRRYPEVYQFVLLTDDTAKTAAFYRSLGLTAAEDCGCRAFLKI